jgi:hemoglobin-like flavoprotein
MNKQTILLLRNSFAEIARRRPDVAAVFYKRLFEVAPAVKPLFTSDPKQQQQKLTAALAQVVASLEQPEKLQDHLTRLGQRHVGYGAEPAHYAVVGDVLLWTFQQVLQSNFTAPVRAAWAEAYKIVAKQMIAAGAQVKAKSGAAAKPAAGRVASAKSGAAKSRARKTSASKTAAGKVGAARKTRSASVAADGGKRKAARKPPRKTARRRAG